LRDAGNILLILSLERNYLELQSTLERNLRESSWSEIIQDIEIALKALKEREHYTSHYGMGFIKDALLRILDLEFIRGLDFEPFGLFANLTGTTINELRIEADAIALKSLSEQIAKRNIFFLDFDEMSTTRYAIFVQQIIQARTDEIKELPSKPPLRQLYSTYYGFMLLVNGGVKTNLAGLQDETKYRIEEFSEQLGKKTEVSARIPKKSQKAFQNCTQTTGELLWQLVRLSNGGQEARLNALKQIRQLGDSRALDFIMLQKEHSRWRYGNQNLEAALWALGNIPSAETLVTQLSSRGDRRRVLFNLKDTYISGIDGIFIETINNTMRYPSLELYKALARTRTVRAFDFLTERYQGGNRKQSHYAMESLLKCGSDGREIITEDHETLSKVILRGYKPVRAVEIAGSIPDFAWTGRTRTRIAKMLNQSTRRRKLLGVISSIDDLLVSEVILESLAKAVRRYTRYSQSYWYRRRYQVSPEAEVFLSKALMKTRNPAYWSEEFLIPNGQLNERSMVSSIAKLILHPPSHLNDREYQKLVKFAQGSSKLMGSEEIFSALNHRNLLPVRGIHS